MVYLRAKIRNYIVIIKKIRKRELLCGNERQLDGENGAAVGS